MRSWTLVSMLFCALLASSCTNVSTDPALAQEEDLDRPPAVPPSDTPIPFTDVDQDTDSDQICDQGPVKVALLVDTSGSMQFTDPHPASRQAAVQALIDQYMDQPHISFAVLRFNSRVTLNGPGPEDDLFTRDPAVLSSAVSMLSEADAMSDYQGGLTVLRDLISTDLQLTPIVDRERTRYVAVFLTDGGPGPVCMVGCDNDDLFSGATSGGGECTGGYCGVPGQALSWCDLPRDSWCGALNLDQARCDEVQFHWFMGLEAPCQAYNSSEEILLTVKEIMDLNETFGAAGIELHTRMVLDASFSEELFPLFTLNPAQDGQLLESMALRGGGTFQDAQQGPFDLTNLDLAGVGCAP